MIRVWLAVLVLLLQACTTSVVVEGTVPTPLVSKIPARIGVYYSDEFRNFRYREVIQDAGTWNIDLGSQNLTFFRHLMGSLFRGVQEVHEPPLTRDEMTELDGVIIPRIEKYGFLTPRISGLKFYSASIEYRIALYDKAGKKVGDWNIIGYGKSEGGMFSTEEAINEATVLAIRDGGARIAIELIDQPAVRDWINRLESIEPKPGLNATKQTDISVDEEEDQS
ncbi:MAG: hypothetical protein HOC70_02645 [Gammaproteobacteria bacterium]|nr:hypothetical protein [Gammaproteobacteria bacterium]MBT4492113.1 hypothetical protein [Gammaproteobacteria bacterium]MBT7371099.1 hypothetical protein [Gammaproteobacteria bacterium]